MVKISYRHRELGTGIPETTDEQANTPEAKKAAESKPSAPSN
jgi:hypothetical protein